MTEIMKTLKTNNLNQSLLIIIFEIKINDKAIREKYRNKHVDESDFFNRSFGKLWSRFFEISPLSPKKKKKKGKNLELFKHIFET